jgi:hypothetical protein
MGGKQLLGKIDFQDDRIAVVNLDPFSTGFEVQQLPAFFLRIAEAKLPLEFVVTVIDHHDFTTKYITDA